MITVYFTYCVVLVVDSSDHCYRSVDPFVLIDSLLDCGSLVLLSCTVKELWGTCRPFDGNNEQRLAVNPFCPLLHAHNTLYALWNHLNMVFLLCLCRFILNWRLWKHAKFAVQKLLFESLAAVVTNRDFARCVVAHRCVLRHRAAPLCLSVLVAFPTLFYTS